MIALLRLLVVTFVVSTVFYIVLRLYARSLRRERLEREWDEGGMTGDREAYIRDGLADYDRGLRPRLILGVYVVPAVAISVIVYLTNQP